MAHDRSTDTTRISRTKLHGREDKFSVHNERGPHARSVKMIERSVPAYASDLELMRVAAQLSGLRPDDQTRRSHRGEPRIPAEMQDWILAAALPTSALADIDAAASPPRCARNRNRGLATRSPSGGVLVAGGGEPSPLAAKAATSTIPIVFAIGQWSGQGWAGGELQPAGR